MSDVHVKSLLHPVHGDMEHFFYADWNMNLYRGCSHGCIYCDSRSVCYRLNDFDHPRAKENALVFLEDELRRKRKPGVITMGAMSDPYNPLEKDMHLTRGALELIPATVLAQHSPPSPPCAPGMRRFCGTSAVMRRYAPDSPSPVPRIRCADGSSQMYPLPPSALPR